MPYFSELKKSQLEALAEELELEFPDDVKNNEARKEYIEDKADKEAIDEKVEALFGEEENTDGKQEEEEIYFYFVDDRSYADDNTVVQPGVYFAEERYERFFADVNDKVESYKGMDEVPQKTIDKYANKYTKDIYDEDDNRKSHEQILEELALKFEKYASTV